MHIRINKFIAEKHGLSRRAADKLVEAGKVFVNGKKAALGDQVNDGDAIEIKGAVKNRFSYYAYYKPRGLITHKQRKGEKDIASEVKLPGMFPVGRLDKDSEGLILLTDDGRITDKLLNPKYDHEKEYIVTTRVPVKDHMLRVMARGMQLEGGLVTKPAKTKRLGKHTFSITLSEGKKHEIRRMCDAFSLPIESLKRVRFMNIRLGDLKPGQFRKLEGKELETLLKSAK
ncbi:MAG: rRNA pseudouridine synthase [Patescibacteria group bacterium]|nr:rRNA pseudouridine synthase [Patescibacteria group bacterium]MDE1945856.1 rRNA pseudouridine synthase [Patescibacteria group bacterium]